MALKPMPPLKSLVVFEAAARLSSFSAAASELNVTQGAISRQIRHLESYLGKTLFTRTTRRIDLTQTGSQYYQAILPALEGITAATGEIVQWQGGNQLTVATTNALASLWLMPRIPRFQKLQPDLDIRILASDQISEMQGSEYDLAVEYCVTTPKNARITPLVPEEVFPVCSPAYLEEHGPFEGPEDLFDATLLALDYNYDGWVNWPEWFTGLETPYREARRRIKINNYPMVIQGAVAGQGVALAWRWLIDDYLANGSLVRPLDIRLKTKAKFCMLEPKDQIRPKKAVSLFRDWFMQELMSASAIDD